MHPPLFKDHPDCKHVVDDLVRCHQEKSIAKFFGACNEQKFALDRCFKDEKNVKRAENLAKARDFDKKWESGAFDDKTK
eukprot:gene10277-12029_t